MAFRNFRYAHLHAARDAGVSALTAPGHAIDADFPLDNLIDNRSSDPMKFATSKIDSRILLDRGAGTLDAVDRFIIPAGHNIDGVGGTVLLDAADDEAMTTNNTVLVASVDNSQTVIDETFTSNSQRYLRIWLGTSSSDAGAWEIPQMIWTSTVEFTAGPDLALTTDERITNATHYTQRNGMASSVQYGTTQRRFEVPYRRIGGADLTAMESLITAVGITKPLLVDPPSYSSPAATDEPVRWMKLASYPQSGYETFVPQKGSNYKRFNLSLIDHLD